MPRSLAETAMGDFPCGECKLTHLCRTCAAWRELEEGSGYRPSAYGCRLAQLRAGAFGLDETPPPLRASPAA